MTKPRPFGQYFILEKIAQGGMAEIFKGLTYDFSGLKKFIVIKRILPHIAANKDFIRMLIDEAKIAVGLSHGNIAQTYDLGKVADDYFIVMEFVEGRTISQIFKKTVELKEYLPIPMAAYFVAELSNGLDYIHRRVDEEGRPLEIVHRDISPQNVIVSYSGNVKIVDFGVAKAAWKLSEMESGVLKGKFAYMSPEQTEGRPIDHCSDLFSTGVVLWEILTGRRLFKKKSNAETIEAVQNMAIYPPSAYRNEIPSDLDEIVMKVLDRRPEKRHPYAADLALALTKFNLKHYPEFKPAQINDYLNQIFEDEDRTGDLYQEKTMREDLTVKDGGVPAFEFEDGATAVEDTMIVDPQELDFHSIFDDIDVDDVSDVTRSIGLKSNAEAAGPAEEESTGDFEPDFFEEPLLTPMPAPAAAPEAAPKDPGRKRKIIGGLVLLALVALLVFYRYGVATDPGSLLLNFEPADARVEIDGVPQEAVSPLRVKGLAPRKIHYIALSREGYQPLKAQISLWPGASKSLSLKMKKAAKSGFTVTSNPPGAAIFIDGQPTGKTTPAELNPAQLKFPVVIGLSKGDAPQWQERLEKIPAGGVLNGDLNVAYGRLEVESSPSGAQVSLAGKKIGKTPLRDFQVEALQDLDLEITMNGFETYRTTLNIHPGEREKIYHALRKQPSR